MSLRRTIPFLGVAGVIGLVSLAPALVGQSRAPAGAQLPSSYRAPRAADGHPDLNGIWQAFVTANWNLEDHEAQPGPHPELSGAYGAGPAGQSIVEGGEIPYRPDALAKRKANFENRLMVDVSNEKKCGRASLAVQQVVVNADDQEKTVLAPQHVAQESGIELGAPGKAWTPQQPTRQ